MQTTEVILTNRRARFVRLEKSVQCLPGEIWRQIVGFENYAISNLGRVMRIAYSKSKNHSYVPGRLLKVTKVAGYPIVRMYSDGKCFSKGIHVLIAVAFIGPCPPDKEVDHKDTNKENFSVGNLEYVTHKENIRRARKFGLLALGEENGKSKLTEEQVRKILLSDSRVPGHREKLAKEFGVSKATVVDVCLGRSWKWIRWSL